MFSFIDKLLQLKLEKEKREVQRLRWQAAMLEKEIARRKAQAEEQNK